MPEEETVTKTKLYGTSIFLSIPVILYKHDLLQIIALKGINVLQDVDNVTMSDFNRKKLNVTI